MHWPKSKLNVLSYLDTQTEWIEEKITFIILFVQNLRNSKNKIYFQLKLYIHKTQSSYSIAWLYFHQIGKCTTLRSDWSVTVHDIHTHLIIRKMKKKETRANKSLTFLAMMNKHFQCFKKSFLHFSRSNWIFKLLIVSVLIKQFYFPFWIS